MNPEEKRRAAVLASVIETYRPNLSQWATVLVKTALATMSTRDMEEAATYLVTRGIDRQDGRSIPGLLRWALDRVREDRALDAARTAPVDVPMNDEEYATASAKMLRLRQERGW